ncbi:MAG: acyclic terpene utilization AtuA family protein [Pseudomonadota bacterium]
MNQKTIRIGGASGYWGDASLATPQLLNGGKLDYIVYDYLAEITMSIMARARAADAEKGYAVDFVSAAMGHNLKTIAEQGVKVIANAGGVNPRACAAAIRELVTAQGLELKVATITGDDILARVSEFADKQEMFSGEPFPPEKQMASMNAYLGAFPIAEALNRGADIVVTGRCVDSAVTLGACIHSFEWGRDEFDKLAQGSLAGHILECGTQATGGNFTDWESVIDSLGEAGYPIAEISADASFTVTKPESTGGLVSIGTVAEQMLYEIGDPQAYLLPDVVCDFSEVELEQTGTNQVRVTGAKGHGAPDSYKVSATWADGFRAGHVWTMYGRDAANKARLFAEQVFARSERLATMLGLGSFSETSCEVIGVESHYGTASQVETAREVDVKIAVKHPSPKGVGIFLKEMIGLALTAPPGLTGFAGARAKPSPVVRLFSTLVPKDSIQIRVEMENASIELNDPTSAPEAHPEQHQVPPISPDDSMTEVALEQLAWARSGDKGDKANIGVIARKPDYVPWIAAALTEARVARLFAHFLAAGQSQPVERFYMPGPNAFNFLLHDVLGGGGIASLRSDPQGKGYSQLLLAEMIEIPSNLAADLS